MPNGVHLVTAAETALAIGETISWTPADHDHGVVANIAAAVTFIVTSLFA